MTQHKMIDASLFLQMMRAGAKRLTDQVEKVNALNVFPVPDGDTGTNMGLTITSGVKEMEKHAHETSVGKLAEALSKGLLMGARGNSGVILSQLFRGFSKALAEKDTISARQLADAFHRGVETAYKAVIKPVEGTILTVSREAAEAGMNRSWTSDDPAEIMEAVLDGARRALAKTPELLPILKQTGVVDAGGQGLVFVYEGMLSALKGEVDVSQPIAPGSQDFESLADLVHDNAQAKVDPATIEHGYCTEFIINLKTTRRPTESFDERKFREEISQFGDSLLVVADEDLVKVHIHAEYPGDALNCAMKYGDLSRIKIENMREQYENVTQGQTVPADSSAEKKPYGIIAVASGDGIAEIFKSVGVDVVIEGGQSMNPSTEDLVRAIEQISANHVIILPNNKNIILTAEQVSELVSTPVTVIPTRSIPQGLAALLAFDENHTAEENRQKMITASKSVTSGEVTFAVRDTTIGDLEIKKDDFLGILEGKIEVTGKDLLDTSLELLAKMGAENKEVLTILYGADVSEEQVNALSAKIAEAYPDLECDVYYGGQPLYYFLFSIE